MTYLRVLTSFLFLSLGVKAEAPMRYDAVGQANWAPYFTQDKKYPGLFVEIIESILNEASISAIPVRSLKNTSPKAFVKKEVDIDIISPSWYENNDVPDEYLISARIVPISEYIVFRPEDKLLWPNKKSLTNQQVGVVKNYVYHDEKSYVRQEYSSEQALLEALINKKISVAIIGELPFHHWTQKMGINVKSGALHSRGYLHIRVRKQDIVRLKKINKAIVSLQESGDINRIFETYASGVFARND